MSDLDDFLTPTLTRQLEAEQAIINGDPGPRLSSTTASSASSWCARTTPSADRLAASRPPRPPSAALDLRGQRRTARTTIPGEQHLDGHQEGGEVADAIMPEPGVQVGVRGGPGGPAAVPGCPSRRPNARPRLASTRPGEQEPGRIGHGDAEVASSAAITALVHVRQQLQRDPHRLTRPSFDIRHEQ
jgi:hypothetical protein